MKTLFGLLLSVLLVSQMSLAVPSESVVSIFRTVQGQLTPIISIEYSDSILSSEFRYNFDAPGTFGLFAGHEWKYYHTRSDTFSFSVKPMIGLMWERYRGIGPQLYTDWQTKTKNVFLLNQFSHGLHGPDFTFNYLEMSQVVNKFMTVNIGAQLYDETSHFFKPQFDIGPQVMFYHNGAFAKIWYTWGTSPQDVKKLFVFFGISV